jgi:acyl carrier protein
MSSVALDPDFEKVLRCRLAYLPADAPLSPDVPLKSLGLDSMQAVELIFDIEDALGVALPDEAMTAQTFDTAASLWAAVRNASEQVPLETR